MKNVPNRILKESIRTSDSINDLSWFEEVLFYRLIVSCDDFGRFDGRTAIIKGNCFPLKSGVTEKQIEEALNKLVMAGMVCRYEANGKPYLQLLSWEQHQQVRAKKSKYPALTSECKRMETLENICNQMISDVPVIQSNPNPNPNTNPNSARKAEALELFEKLWKLYPSKKGKGKVSDAKKLELLKIGFDEMSRAVDRYIMELEKDRSWRKPQNGNTFFTSGYVDYLDANFEPSKHNNDVKPGSFNDFQQRQYDFDALEKQLLGHNQENGKEEDYEHRL